MSVHFFPSLFLSPTNGSLVLSPFLMTGYCLLMGQPAKVSPYKLLVCVLDGCCWLAFVQILRTRTVWDVSGH